MFAALITVSCMLALALIATGVAKLAGHTATVESLTAVGFPVKFAPALASAELAGAVGLLLGLHWWPVGVAAAAGVVMYFLGAVVAHLRARQGSVAPAAALFVLATSALVLRLITR